LKINKYIWNFKLGVYTVCNLNVFSGNLVYFRVFSGLLGSFLGLVGSFWFFSGLLGKNHCRFFQWFKWLKVCNTQTSQRFWNVSNDWKFFKTNISKVFKCFKWLKVFQHNRLRQDSALGKAMDLWTEDIDFDPGLNNKRRLSWATMSFSMWDNNDLLV
jgi:hypothetical protein